MPPTVTIASAPTPGQQGDGADHNARAMLAQLVQSADRAQSDNGGWTLQVSQGDQGGAQGDPGSQGPQGSQVSQGGDQHSGGHD